MREKDGILVSDVCGTLFYENTTLGFIKFHLKKTSKLNYLIFLLITHKFSPILWIFKIIEYISYRNKNLFKNFIVSFIKGQREKDVKKTAKIYVKILFKEKKINTVWNFLTKYKNKNYRIILASSSIDPIVKEIAKKIKAEYFSSCLETKNKRFTGNFLINISGNKIKYLRILGIEYKKINFFFSDNFEDLDLIKKSQKGFAIVHSLKRSGFWKQNKVKRMLWV